MEYRPDDLTDILYQFDSEYIRSAGRDSGSPFACVLESEGPARSAVKAERSEFIAEP